MPQTTTLRPGQIRHLLRVTNETSRHPERDCLVPLLDITCGMRVTEIAQIEVQDVLFSSGIARQEVSLRAGLNTSNKMDMRFDQYRSLDWLID